MMSNSRAPITLFVFNRPWHTRQTVEALQNNALAKESELFIFSDGPKSDDDRKAVREVREYLRTITGFKSVSRIERADNLGLAHSIISGVTEIVNRFGCIIVLEDDIVTSPHFLKFMNEALSRYENEERVMHVAGYMFPIDASNIPETFFYRGSSCWGWGTWRRAWNKFEPDPAKLIKIITDRKLKYEFNFLGSINYLGMLKYQAKSRVDSWAIRWYASVFLNQGLCLHPAQSLVQNIGHDSGGVHCDKSDAFNVNLKNGQITYFETLIEENNEALNRLQQYFESITPTLYEKLTRKSKELLSPIGRFFLKKTL